ncbi:MAG: ATP-dependent RecD-like DNA helicase [Gammaproteobacteria bacterium]|jgi:ATP-dependent DNA helicase PIF1
MDPLSLLALTAAAGFLFDKLSKPAPPDNRAIQSAAKVAANGRTHADASRRGPVVEVLPEYVVVRDLVRQRFPLIFVTGSAGTGKSTFVKWLTEEFSGKTLLAAPTGMAAINIGGRTIHSLCRFPPAWILDGDIKKDDRRAEIKGAQLLIIDEVSMVNANLLDAISKFFSCNRGDDRPFGGLSVVMVGDLFQLPPVIRGDMLELFEKEYGGAKFFYATCLKKCSYYAVELTKTFRQSEQQFVDTLQRVREARNLSAALLHLNTKCQIQSEAPSGYVWLSPRNREVDARNDRELEKLTDTLRTYVGTVTGRFKTEVVASPMQLRLKKGAQVMFTQNDGVQKRWINGSLGRVESLSDTAIAVRVFETSQLVYVEKAEWIDYEYGWDSEKKVVIRKEAGKYTQLPLMLAWSMTIHKSQGRTIDRVHIDLGDGAFETGQTYVALSRCRTIDGLSLSRPLREKDILVDSEARHFYDQLRETIARLPLEKMIAELRSRPST